MGKVRGAMEHRLQLESGGGRLHGHEHGQRREDARDGHWPRQAVGNDALLAYTSLEAC